MLDKLSEFIQTAFALILGGGIAAVIVKLSELVKEVN
tara:strand:- start:585 stop:695 length:111 start_codon:yes stop_codon:yes gene_type:complete